MKFNVTDIEFDFDDGNDGESYALTFDEEIALRDTALGIYEADDEDDLIEIITDGAGYCIKSIDYDILDDYSLGNQDDTFIDINNTGGKY